MAVLESINSTIKAWLPIDSTPPEILDSFREIGSLCNEETRFILSWVLSAQRNGRPYTAEEVKFIKELLASGAGKEDILLWLGLYRESSTMEVLPNHAVETIIQTVRTTLEILGRLEPPVTDLSSIIGKRTLLQQLRLDSGEEELPFWEQFCAWESLQQTRNPNASRRSSWGAFVVEDPSSRREFVVKPKALDLEECHPDPRKIALFQEATRYYSVRTLEEVTVLPTEGLARAKKRGLFLRNLCQEHPVYGSYQEYMSWAEEEHQKEGKRGLRVAERMPHFEHPIQSKDGREALPPEERAIIDAWYPAAIFDDIRIHTYEATSRGSSWELIETKIYEHNIDAITLNPGKFKKWYEEADSPTQEKARKSIEGLHRMASNGFFFDLYGALNYAFYKGEFILIDVEPLQLSNIPQGTECLSYSEQLLNDLFAVVGLSKISYADIVQKIYGKDKYLRRKSYHQGFLDIDAGRIKPPSEYWKTNVTNDEELKLYRKRLAEQIAEQGSITRPNILPQALLDAHAELLTKPDSFFENEKYDWTVEAA